VLENFLDLGPHFQLSLMCEMLETVKIRSPGFAQGYNFAVDNRFRAKIIKRFGDLRESSWGPEGLRGATCCH
jgi:hypothetical protein